MAKKINLESSLKAESVEKEIAERYYFAGIAKLQIMGPTADDYRAEGFPTKIYNYRHQNTTIKPQKVYGNNESDYTLF